jgi:hypothetical protein
MGGLGAQDWIPLAKAVAIANETAAHGSLVTRHTLLRRLLDLDQGTGTIVRRFAGRRHSWWHVHVRALQEYKPQDAHGTIEARLSTLEQQHLALRSAYRSLRRELSRRSGSGKTGPDILRKTRVFDEHD